MERVFKPFSRISFLQNVTKRFRVSLFDNKRLFSTKRNFEVGEKAAISRVFGQNEVDLFAELTGDRNPIHTDREFAQNTRFGRCVVHGALINGLISCLHGTELPGSGCLVVSQQIKFPTPLFVGEMVSAEVEVLSYRHSIMVCSAICKAVDRNEVVLSGETKLFIPKATKN